MPAIREDWYEAEQLIFAAQDGDIARMNDLLASGYDLNLMDVISKGALHYAVEREHYNAAEWLIAQGATVDLRDGNMAGDTPTKLAAEGNYPEIAELLLRNGADPDVWGWMGVTARMRADQRTDSEGKAIARLFAQYKPLQTAGPKVRRRGA